jgi:hypothetical protein
VSEIFTSGAETSGGWELEASGLTGAPRDQELAVLARTFAERDVVALPGLLGPTLRRRVVSLSSELALDERGHKGIGRELSTMSGPLFSMLLFAVNDPAFLRVAEAITGLTPLRSFEGRVYRLDDSGTYDSWHSDIFETRRVGMSVNLSPTPYEGGTFQLRHLDRPDEIREHPNLELGGALLFRIGDHLRHRVTPVIGVAPKTAFAGWFRNEPDFRDVLRGKAKL